MLVLLVLALERNRHALPRELAAVQRADAAQDPRHGSVVRIGPRIAPAIFGVGLLEAVPEKTITEHADPRDADGDGISGRPNRVIDARTGALVLGRFGWKGNVPTVEQQNAGAFKRRHRHHDPDLPHGELPRRPARLRGRAARRAAGGRRQEARPRDLLRAHARRPGSPCGRSRAHLGG